MQVSSDDQISEDDESGSAFLEGLKDLGLLGNDEIETTKKTESTKKSKKSPMTTPKKTRPKPKRRPPKRPTINIDDLLDGITTPSPQATPPASTPINTTSIAPNTSDFPFSPVQKHQFDQPTSIMNRIELNIQSYLNNQFMTLRDDFIHEFQQYISQNDIFEKDVNLFMEDLKVGIREALKVEISLPNVAPRLTADMANILPAFNEIMQKNQVTDISQKEEEVRSASLGQIAISTFAPMITEKLNTTIQTLSNDYSSLHDSRNEARAVKIKSRQKHKMSFNRLVELECRRSLNNIESETISNISRYLTSYRKSLRDDTDDYEYDDPQQRIDIKFESSITKLRREVDEVYNEPISRIRSYQRKYAEIIDEISSARQMFHYHNQIYLSRASQMIVQPMPVQIPLRAPVPPTPNRVAPRVSFPELEEPEEVSENNKLIGSVRMRLKEIQNQRELDLENISSFLQSFKHSEKMRIRSSLPNT